MADILGPLSGTTAGTQALERTSESEAGEADSLQISAVAPTVASAADPSAELPAATLPSDAATGSGRGSTGRASVGGVRPVPTLGGELRGSLVGKYMIIKKLGEGGMGQVYAAYDADLDRRVAIKLLRTNYQTSTALDRLMREAQGLARLSHPNVVHVHEVGRHEGATYIAMEYVVGQTLREHLGERPNRSWRETLAILVQAGHGLAAAHAKKLVHRDFKPDNVMVAEDGIAKVLDFGLVRTVADDRPEQHEGEGDGDGEIAISPAAKQLTRSGAIMGTPAYMALEQLEGRRADEQTDQFAFCVVLFEALYGYRPFEGDTGAAVAARMYAGEVRPRPAKSEVPRVVHDAIVRGLAAKPEERWPDMTGLLAELERSLEQRRRGWIWLSVGALAALVGLVVVATPLINEALSERDQTIAAQEEDLDARAAELAVANEELAQRHRELEQQFEVQQGLTATLLADSPGRALEALYLALRLNAPYAIQGGAVPLQLETALYAATRGLHDARELLGHRESIVGFAFSPDASRLVTASRDDTAKLWQLDTGELVRSFSGHVNDLRTAEFSPDGARLLTTSDDGSATIWVVESARALATIDDYEVAVARFAPDGRSIAVGSSDGSLSWWTAAPGEPIAEQQAVETNAAIVGLSFAPDGRGLLVAHRGKSMSLWQGQRELGRFETAEAKAQTFGFSPDGNYLYLPGPAGDILLRDANSGAARATLVTGHGELHAVAVAPAGEPRLLSAGLHGAPKLWQPETASLIAEVPEHRETVTALAFSPDGRRFATVGYDARLRLGDAESGRVLETLEGSVGRLIGVGFAPDNSRIASLTGDRVRLWSAARLNEQRLVAPRGRDATAIAFAPDRSVVAIGERSGSVGLWALDGSERGSLVRELDHGGKAVYAAAFSSDGSLLATGVTGGPPLGGLVRVWSSAGELVEVLPGHRSDVKAVAFSPDGSLLASVDIGGQLELWQRSDWSLVREWQADDRGVTALAFSPDGSKIATAGMLGLVNVWSTQTGEREHLLGAQGLLFALAFSPDGSRVAVTGDHKQIEIWSLADETRVAEIVGEDPSIDAVAFSPDGTRLLSGGEAWVRLWDIDTGLRIANFAAHDSRVFNVAFSADSATVFSGSDDGEVRSSVADPGRRLHQACRALRGNHEYAEVASVCTAILDAGTRGAQ